MKLTKLPLKVVCCIAFGSDLVLVVYLSLLLLSNNILQNRNNLVESQFYNHLPDLLQFFKC